MSEWKECKLQDCISDVIDNRGRNPKVYYELNEYPVIDNYLIKNTLYPDLKNVSRYIDKDAYENFIRNYLKKGDVLLTLVGNGIGNLSTAPTDKVVIIQNTIGLRVNSQIDNMFLYYYLLFSQSEITNFDRGSTQPSIKKTDVLDMSIYIPGLSEQHAISSILSSLDDKIDLLHRQNATLEKMAETLFRQWFVEEAKEEWDEVELGDVIETTSGGTPSRTNMAFYKNGVVNWVKSKELNGTFILDTEEKITDEALKKSSAKILPKNSILIAMYGATVGEYAIISKEMTCNQAVCALKPNDDYPFTYLFLLIKSNKEELINMAVGSAQQNISQLLIKKLPVLNCTERIKDFDSIVSPYFEKIKSNIIQIRTLTSLRDTLLPKLMSGEVRVE